MTTPSFTRRLRGGMTASLAAGMTQLLPPILPPPPPSDPGPKPAPKPSPQRETPRPPWSEIAQFGRREIPVGVSNVHNQVMRSRDNIYAIRFVLDRPTRIHRFFSGFNLEGVSRVGGRAGYSSGNGGRIRARLVRVDRRGRPRLRSVIAQETVNAVPRYFESAAEFGVLPQRTQLLHFNMGGVRLRAGRMYAMTYQNMARRPARDWFSTNSPTVRNSEAGPNGRNNLDRRARGAVAGLDPREAVAWSGSRGRRWVWGRAVGQGRLRGLYGGSFTGDGGARLPWYGWQAAPGAPVRSPQPYYAYGESGPFSLYLAGSPRAVRLTAAGGYAPHGRRVGTVTVKNLRTGQEGATGPLGGGIALGRLRPPVDIARGDSYLISASGRVLKAEGDAFIVKTFGVGRLGSSHPFATMGQGVDRAEVFALPHPFF